MPRGPFGFRRLTSFGPFVEDEDKLFHFTKPILTDSILQEGFEEGDEKAESIAGQDPDVMLSATRMVDNIIDHYRPYRRGYIPKRTGSNFFFNNTENVEIWTGGKVRDEERDIIVIDRNEISVRGGTATWDDISEAVNSIRSNINMKMDVMQEVMVDWIEPEINFNAIPDQVEEDLHTFWMRDAELYKGHDDTNNEVWFKGRIPPSAIVGVIEAEERDA